MPVTPAELPEDLVGKPTVYLKDLKPGESGWICWLYMVVDPDRHCFLNPDAKIYAERSQETIRVIRTNAGFDVLIPKRRLPLYWVPGAFSVGEEFFPVIRLEREEPK